MQLQNPVRFLPILTLAALAGCTPGPDVGASEVAIVGGALGGDPAVVWIYNSDEGGLCTGTLIEPRVVLTAKHCVQPPGAAGPTSASRMVVGIGDRAGSGRTLRVQSVYAPPGMWTDSGSLSGLIGYDIGVMVLVTGVTDIAPIPIRRESPAGIVGDAFTATGFGQIPSGSAGTKYTVMGRVTGVERSLIYVGAVTCQGDSGGPMVLEDGTIAGVVSFGNGSCGTGYGAYQGIYDFLPLIDMAIEEGGGCVNDELEETTCDGRDNDCDGEADETCTPIGGVCADDSECVGNTCRETIAGHICTQECDARRPDFGCGDGLYCARSGAGACEGFCVPLTGSAGLPNDAPCASDGECTSLYCADPGDGTQRCLTSCERAGGMCLAGEVCVSLTGACGGCVPAEIVSGLAHGLGEPCSADADCSDGGTCVDDEGSRYCSRSCDETTSCPGAYHCRGETCVRGTLGGIGESCVDNEDCSGGTFCAVRGDTSWCTSLCTDDASCPARFSCVDAGGVRVCAPSGGLVGDACDAPDDCISGLCATDLVCVRECGVDSPCGPGFECRRTTDGADALCVRPIPASTGGGCAVSGVGASGGTTAGRGMAAILVALSALATLGRRRARRV